jgi:hypothetical protein
MLVLKLDGRVSFVVVAIETHPIAEENLAFFIKINLVVMLPGCFVETLFN